MRNKILIKFLLLGIIVLFILSSLTPMTIGYNNKTAKNQTEYWALLIAGGVYAEHPDQDRPSMLEEVENMYDLLLVSQHWKEDHIKVIKGEDATMWNIFKGLIWLNNMDDKDDFSLVYIATHGGQLSRDIWPRDEEDGRDEVLASYHGFQFSWANIRDDLLNLMLSLLSARGVCVIVDSCYSGGFNDKPYFSWFTRSRQGFTPKGNRVSASKWIQELGQELRGRGRVVLMSCQEDELSYGSKFTKILIESLRGYADVNEDGIVSAEEAYQYAKDNIDSLKMHPTIFDNYPGDFPLTEAEFPPSVPKTPTGQMLGETNTTYTYSTVSIDPEGGKISYGWDWDSDYIVDEWTDPVDSNTTVNTIHSWAMEGTYNIRVKAKDEFGVLSDWSGHTVVIMCDDNIPDQWQIEMSEGAGLMDNWLAQSFVPSIDTLSKVEIALISWGPGDPIPLNLYIRDNLSGDNLVESSQAVPYTGSDKYAWFTFDFEDLNVIPGHTYYIVCQETHKWVYIWEWIESDCYPPGELFISNDGKDWKPFPTHVDFSFVTWGKI